MKPHFAAPTNRHQLFLVARVLFGGVLAFTGLNYCLGADGLALQPGADRPLGW